MSEFWSNFQTKAAERSRSQVPRFEVLMRIAQSTVLSGQVNPLFLLGLRAGIHADSTPSTAYLWLSSTRPCTTVCRFVSGSRTQGFPS